MPLKVNAELTSSSLVPAIERLFELSAAKILALEQTWDPAKGSPVITASGVYTSRGWTEWTQGFQFGSSLIQFEATGDRRFLELGRSKTFACMPVHVSHMGVHDHGFNNVSTYGNLWRMLRDGVICGSEAEQATCELALRISGAVQAARWTPIADGTGYIYSFNGPHSLFVDTIRSLRSLALAYSLGHVLMGEQDQRISLLGRLIQHARATALFNVYYGEGRDLYDVRGRTAHESIFNVNNGTYRCPSSQQGYSPFTTWTRGLAWAILGFAEELEFLASANTQFVAAYAALPAATHGESATNVLALLLRAARATADFYLNTACTDGVPVWDTGAPNLSRLGDYANREADPFNAWEPVDSSAAAIAAQGFWRLGNYLRGSGESVAGNHYRQAGLTIARVLLDQPYLSTSADHQGLLLHSVYHRPNGWDYIPPGRSVPCGESSMWGDYHLRELALVLLADARDSKCLAFFGSADSR